MFHVLPLAFYVALGKIFDSCLSSSLQFLKDDYHVDSPF